MESKIIPDEILRLHMIEESEKLLSNIKNGEVNGRFFLVRVGIRIYRYRGQSDNGPRECIYENMGFVVSRLVRWKWFFRYLQAREQIKTPRQFVQLESVSYVVQDKEAVLLKVLNNKMIAAKRDRTKVLTRINAEKERQSNTLLFSSLETDPNYIKALEYLADKEKQIAAIEAEISQLCEKQISLPS